MSLLVEFSGWFQCRLATDPDPHDEPAGVAGAVAALADEPPLDRVVRFHDPVAPRSHAPAIGVFVTGAGALAGARVELLGEPKFEGRNGLLAEDGLEPIVPFALRVSGARGVVIERATRPAAEAWIAAPRREDVAHLLGQGADRVKAMPQAFGTTPRERWAQERHAALVAEAAEAEGERRTVVHARLDRFRRLVDEGRELVMLQVRYAFALDGAAAVRDPESALGADVDRQRPWPLAFWMGGWDPDGMCGFVAGVLELPLR